MRYLLLFIFFGLVQISIQAQKTCYDELLQLGNDAYNKNDYDKAISRWQSALNNCDPTSGQRDKLNDYINRAKNVSNNNTPSQSTTTQRDAFESEMVKVQGGTFQMGSDDGEDDEKPVHSVKVSDFYMGKYEITVAQFKVFIDDTGYTTDAEKEGNSRAFVSGKWETTTGVNWKCDVEGNIRPQSAYNHPVIHVSWNDATAYCRWLSKKTSKTYRLPTEAEWEYAAGNCSRHTKYSWGNGDPSGIRGGNVADESAAKKFNFTRNATNIFMDYNDGYAATAPVGQFNPNDFGLYDMTGNVWECCSDWYSDSFYANSSGSSNPKNIATGSRRVLRGGSWLSTAQFCRVAYRDLNTPTYRNGSVGFRVAVSFQ